MIPPGALSGTRRQVMLRAWFLAVFLGLIGLALLVGCLAELLADEPDAILLLGFGSSFAFLSYGFGRIGVSAFTESRRRPVAEPGFLPFVLAVVGVVAGLASIPFLP